MLSRNLKQKEDSYEKGIEWSVGCPGFVEQPADNNDSFRAAG